MTAVQVRTTRTEKNWPTLPISISMDFCRANFSLLGKRFCNKIHAPVRFDLTTSVTRFLKLMVTKLPTNLAQIFNDFCVILKNNI